MPNSVRTSNGVQGGKEAAEAFSRISEQATNAAEQALLRGALMIERDAKINVRVDTGRLRTSITHRLTGAGTASPMVDVGTNVEYAKWIEFGTGLYAVNGDGRKTPWLFPTGKYNSEGQEIWAWTAGSEANPFLFPAFNGNKAKIKEEVANAIRKDLGL